MLRVMLNWVSMVITVIEVTAGNFFWVYPSMVVVCVGSKSKKCFFSCLSLAAGLIDVFRQFPRSCGI